MFNLENQTFVYLSLLIAFSSMVFYAIDKFSMAFKSIVILTFLLIFFSIFPFKGATDANLLNPQSILNGFSNTSLITVISLLILGQGVVNTRVLDGFISNLLKYFPDNTQLIIIVCLFFVLVLSAFINNTPVVIIFIPILQSVVKNSNQSIGKYLMPLSFVAILGGMITIIGSSTNLLVSDSLKTYSNIEISFFEFAIPGSIIAFCGLIYVVIFSKFLLTDRSPISNQLIKDKKNNFITKIIVNENSNLIGKKADEDRLEGLENSEILMIQRGECAEHTPFYSFVMEKGDILVISTSREQLTSILSKNIGSIESFDENEDDSETKKQVITEAMVTPSSSLVGNTIENVSFRYRYDCIVIGLQRKSKIITTNMGELPLEPGDTLLIQGDKKSIKALRTKSDLLPMEWTTSEIQNKNIAKISIFIFLGVIIFGAFEILPLVVASLIGVVSMIASKVLSLRQALRSVDNNLLLLIVTSLALGKVIQVTGAATFLSEYLLDILDGSSPLTILICFYALVSYNQFYIKQCLCSSFCTDSN